MIGGARALVARFAAGEWAFPLPSEAVKDWPLVGERVYRLWDLSATNMKVALAEVAPTLKPVVERLLRIAQGGFLAMLELLVAIVVSGFLFTHGPKLVEALKAFLDRALGHHGQDHVQLANWRGHHTQCSSLSEGARRRLLGFRITQELVPEVGLATNGRAWSADSLFLPGSRS